MDNNQSPTKVKISSRNSLRYRLHNKLRKEGFNLNTVNRTIYFSYDIPLPESKTLKRLIDDFGYAVQLSL